MSQRIKLGHLLFRAKPFLSLPSKTVLSECRRRCIMPPWIYLSLMSRNSNTDNTMLVELFVCWVWGWGGGEHAWQCLWLTSSSVLRNCSWQDSGNTMAYWKLNSGQCCPLQLQPLKSPLGIPYLFISLFLLPIVLGL